MHREAGIEPAIIPILQVFAPLLHGIKKTPGLMERLNEVNVGLTFARAFWVEEQVIVTIELRAESLDADQVAQAVSVVSLAANYWDGAIKQEFEGETSFPDEPAQPAPETQPAGGAGSSDVGAPADSTDVPGAAKADEPSPGGYL